MRLKEKTGPGENHLLLCVTVFIIGFWVFNDFAIRYLYGYALMGLVLIVELACFGVVISGTKIKWWFSALVGAAAVFSLLPSSNYNSLTFALTISMVIFWLYALLAKPDRRQIFTAFRLVKGTSLLMSLYLIVMKIRPSLYWNYVFPHLSEVSQQEAERLMHDGYGVPVGASAIYADYLITVGILILFGEFLFLVRRGQTWRKLWIGGQLAIFFAAMLAENRRTEVLMIVLTLAFLFLLLMNPRHERDFTRKFGLLFAVAALVVLAGFVCLQVGLLDRFVKLFTEITTKSATQSEMSGGRTTLWATAWELFREHPLLGIGWEQFITRNPYAHEVHNSYLQFLCETGVVGFVLLSFPILRLLGLSLSQLRRLIWQEGESFQALKLFNLVGTGMQLFFFLVNFLDPAFYHQNYFCFYSFAMILVSYCYEQEQALCPAPVFTVRPADGNQRAVPS